MKNTSLNMINIQILIDQDNSTESIEVDCDLSATMPPEQRLYYENLTHGLVTKLNTEIDSFANIFAFLSSLLLIKVKES